MDIKLDGFVESLTQQILQQVQSKVDDALRTAIKEQLFNIDIQARVDAAADAAAKLAVEKYQPDTANIEQQINSAAKVIIDSIQANAKNNVESTIRDRIANVDFDRLATQSINGHLDSKLRDYAFPANSIPASAIKFDTTISGDAIDGGIVKNFGSTGIDDKATDCRLTILDDHTVFENNLLAAGLTVKGPTVLEGDVTIKGTIPESSPGFINIVNAAKSRLQAELGTEMFVQYRDLVFEKIQADGIDLSKVKLNGADVIVGNALTPNITESNLQKVGVLKELQVKGESLFNNSVYIADKRVGINTIEPGATLSIWDEEVEIQISKKRKDTAFIGSTRHQTVILSSNNKENLTLNADGSVSVQTINIGRMQFGTATSAPSHEAPKGTVLFNENPSLGGPLGWVSLGDARWANFGIID
jgi:hypothetical protein